MLVINLCLTEGVFPESLKTAVVIPIFKKGDSLDPNCYRPISLLTVPSKIFEKIIKTRLVTFMETNNIISRNQFGFRKGLSTEDALVNFMTPVYEHMNNGNKVGALLIDITKAFDTVNHNILLHKMYCMGIRGTSYSLIKSYLRERTQMVKIQNEFSSEIHLNVGVPQGSVIGPILFLFYIESIFKINLHGEITAFADDMALVYNGPSFRHVSSYIESVLQTLRKWFTVHEMVLSDKTKIMYFDLTGNIPYAPPIIYHGLKCDSNNLICDNSCIVINVVNDFKYLGIILDSKLNWKEHVENLKRSLIIANRKIYHLRCHSTKAILKLVYHSLIDSRLQYGIVIWGGTYNSTIKPIIISQKHILRVINKKPRIYHSHPLFVQDNILHIRNLYIFKVLKMFYKRSGYTNSVKQNPRYTLRNTAKCCYAKPKNEHYRKYYSYIAPFVYNKLPNHIKILVNINQFIKALRCWLLSKNFEEIELLLSTCK